MALGRAPGLFISLQQPFLIWSELPGVGEKQRAQEMGFHDEEDGISKPRCLQKGADLFSSNLQRTVPFEPSVCTKSYLAVSNWASGTIGQGRRSNLSKGTWPD